jgi:hypothetical protein
MMRGFVLAVVGVVLVSVTQAHGFDNSYNVAKVTSEANTEIAWIIAGAIVIAGIAIGVGLFFKKGD